jgi:wobble nucleotide-excising tRNase
MMFQKIDITNFGSFSNFQWAATLPDFKKVNLLYGRNYSGKTTLSRIFRCFETKELHKNFVNPQFTLIYPTGTSQKITQADLQNSPVSDRVFVYNSDFVKANLSWLHDESGSILPFAVAGEINNDIVKRIERFEGKKEGELVVKAGLIERVSNRLNTRTEKFNNENRFLTSKKTNLDNTLTTEAASIKNNADYVPQNEVASYNKNKLKTEINNLKDQLDTRLSDTDKEKYRSTVKEQDKAKVDTKTEKKPKFEDRFNTTKELLAKTITVSQPIESLLHSHALEKWVGDGIDLHRNQRESCAFCDSQLSPEDWQNRWNVLGAHFSQASKELTEKINAEIKACESAKIGIRDYFSFEAHHFYAEFTEQINAFDARCDPC